MKTNNPKDSKEEIPTSGTLEDLFKKGVKKLFERELGDHYPGCHRVHIECANKKIDGARQIFEDARDRYDLDIFACDWLESLGEK